MSASDVINDLYYRCVKNLNWSLYDIENTELESMLSFVFYREPKNKNEFVYKGKVYKRTEGAPSWL